MGSVSTFFLVKHDRWSILKKGNRKKTNVLVYGVSFQCYKFTNYIKISIIDKKLWNLISV